MNLAMIDPYKYKHHHFKLKPINSQLRVNNLKFYLSHSHMAEKYKTGTKTALVTRPEVLTQTQW